jgi:hypothetical protein
MDGVLISTVCLLLASILSLGLPAASLRPLRPRMRLRGERDNRRGARADLARRGAVGEQALEVNQRRSREEPVHESINETARKPRGREGDEIHERSRG